MLGIWWYVFIGFLGSEKVVVVWGNRLVLMQDLGTSKPLDVKYYVGKSMAEDLMAILDKEEIGRVVGIAHDWGTYLLSQLVGWFEERLEAIMFFSVPFSPLG